MPNHRGRSLAEAATAKEVTGSASLVPFAPVALRARQDGWTPEKQVKFIETLAETGIVSHAAERAGMSVESAYRMRRRSTATSFASAWKAAQAHAVQRLTDLAFERAIEGVPTPVFHNGEQVGERRYYSDRLLVFLLRYHDPNKYGVFAKLMEAVLPDFRAIEAEPLEALVRKILLTKAKPDSNGDSVNT
jgi:hypothetical protein